MVEQHTVDTENRCSQVVMSLEGDGSFIVKMEELGFNGTAEFIDFVVQEASKDFDTVIQELIRRRKNGEKIPAVDPNVFIAHRLSLYFSSWYAFVTKFKSNDHDRDAVDRLEYLVANRSFIRDIVSAIESGEQLAIPIMEDRVSKKQEIKGDE